MLLKSVRRLSSFNAKRLRALEWMKSNDSSVEESFERGQFFIFVDQKPLLRLLPSPTTKKYHLCCLKYEQLQRVTGKSDLSLGVEDCALLDIVDNGTEQRWLPIFALNIRLDEDEQKNANDIANDFDAERLDFRQALFCLENSKMANLLSKARNSVPQHSSAYVDMNSSGSNTAALVANVQVLSALRSSIEDESFESIRFLLAVQKRILPTRVPSSYCFGHG
ncbi:hypothetical protein D918_04505 [Trichuris suis]|nr:hypothetical protein D918_04505 [Trichuris suis]